MKKMIFLILLCAVWLNACNALLGPAGSLGDEGASTASPHSVVYVGNGNDGGSVPLDSGTYASGSLVTVLAAGTLSRTGYYFVGWNTASDGSGTGYAAGVTFTMGNSNVSLYAQWSTGPVYTVSYNGNGNDGGSVPTDSNNYLNGFSVAVQSNSGALTLAGYRFSGWNTASDGSGTSYAAGATFSMGSANLILYAQWVPDFAGGDGTVANPFQVATAKHLDNVRYFLTSQFIQTADISLGIAPYNAGSGWVPLGNSTSQFKGVYNGAGKKITGLLINRPAEDYVGLFGYTNGAQLLGIRIESPQISGKTHVGALVGYNSNAAMIVASPAATVENCSAVNVTVSGVSNTGGLVGYNYGSGNSSYPSIIKTSYVTGTVTGTGSNTGGLVGINVYYATIAQSYSQATVTGTTYVGGLVGYTSYGGTVNNSYATGSVTGTSTIGGLAGYAENNTGTITNSYAACTVTVLASSGGLIGTGGTVTVSSYYDQTLSGQSDTGKGTGMVTADMMLQGTFSGWDFGSIWSINAGSSYPYLQWQAGANIPTP